MPNVSARLYDPLSWCTRRPRLFESGLRRVEHTTVLVAESAIEWCIPSHKGMVCAGQVQCVDFVAIMGHTMARRNDRRCGHHIDTIHSEGIMSTTYYICAALFVLLCIASEVVLFVNSAETVR